MAQLMPVYRPSKASERHRGVQEQQATACDTNPQVNLNVASDRHMLLYGGSILNQAHHVTKTRCGCDDGSVQAAEERKMTELYH